MLVHMPFAIWNALAGVAEMLPRPPLTRNQVEQPPKGCRGFVLLEFRRDRSKTNSKQ
jgi:hypothetical protein